MRKTASSRICKQPLIRRECGECKQGQRVGDVEKTKDKVWAGYIKGPRCQSETETTCELHKRKMGLITKPTEQISLQQSVPWAPARQMKPSYSNLPPCTRTNPQTGPKSSPEDPGATDHFPIITCNRGAPSVSSPLGKTSTSGDDRTLLLVPSEGGRSAGRTDGRNKRQKKRSHKPSEAVSIGPQSPKNQTEAKKDS